MPAAPAGEAGGRTLLARAARVVTMAGPDVRAFAVRDGRVADLDHDPAALRARHPGAELLDLGEACVIPAFNDAHAHPSMAAEDLLHLDASPEHTPTRRDLLALLAAEAAAAPPGAWIRASRYDHTRSCGGVALTRADLDAVSVRHPILLTHVGAHWGVANTPALAAGGYDDTSDPPAGGQLGRDGAGRLSGLLGEQALFDYCYPALAAGGAPVIPPASQADRLRALARFASRLHAAGIASVTDALTGPHELRLYAAARAAGGLRVRVNALLAHPHLDSYQELAAADGFGDAWLRLGGVKLFADGAVAGRTCLVEQPFEGSDDHGVQAIDPAELTRLAERCQRRGLRMAVHANGDRAIAMVLAAIEAATGRHGHTGPPHRIEHASILTPDLVAAMRRLGVVAVPFGGYIAYHGAKLLDWYGADRLGRMFAHRWLLDAGVPTAGSSDYPCGPLEPLRALRSCVTRTSEDGRLLGPAQRINVREALALYTTGSAFAAGEQADKGRLAPGFLADFTVLAQDVTHISPERLDRVPVLATWVGGEPVFTADG